MTWISTLIWLVVWKYECVRLLVTEKSGQSNVLLTYYHWLWLYVYQLWGQTKTVSIFFPMGLVYFLTVKGQVDLVSCKCGVLNATMPPKWHRSEHKPNPSCWVYKQGGYKRRGSHASLLTTHREGVGRHYLLRTFYDNISVFGYLVAVVHHICIIMCSLRYQCQKKQFSIDALFLLPIIPFNQPIVLQRSFMANIHGPFIEKTGISHKKCSIKIQINIHIWCLDFKQAPSMWSFEVGINTFVSWVIVRPLQTKLFRYQDTNGCFFYWGIYETPNFGQISTAFISCVYIRSSEWQNRFNDFRILHGPELHGALIALCYHLKYTDTEDFPVDSCVYQC